LDNAANFDPSRIDRTIHSPVRLGILAALIAAEEVEFNFLKRSLSLTDGNLSSHLSRLEDSGYIKIKKTFRGKRPCTYISLTGKGRRAFEGYVDAMEKLIRLGRNRE